MYVLGVTQLVKIQKLMCVCIVQFHDSESTDTDALTTSPSKASDTVIQSNGNATVRTKKVPSGRKSSKLQESDQRRPSRPQRKINTPHDENANAGTRAFKSSTSAPPRKVTQQKTALDKKAAILSANTTADQLLSSTSLNHDLSRIMSTAQAK